MLQAALRLMLACVRSPLLASAGQRPSGRRLSMTVTATNRRDGQPPYSLSVAVVGGGAAGLAAALELRRAGHCPVVYEQSGSIGGVWKYSEEVEDDPLGRGSRHVHGSMYAQLRTNLPREVMGFQAFPFDTAWRGSKDPRQFCEHAEVQRYLEAFAAEFQLLQHVRFRTVVQRLAPVDAADAAANGGSSSSSSAPPDWLRWQVTTQPAADGQAAASSSSTSELFDAVVVCNGHYSRPRLPQLPGQDAFPGLQMHSHNYRRPDGFAGQTVLLVGASSSGVDIAEELAAAGAKQVILCARVWENPLTGEVVDAGSRSLASASPTAAAAAAAAAAAGTSAGGVPAGAVAALPAGIRKATNLAELHADGSVSLENGTRIPEIDCVMYCTGYHYSFPFLDDRFIAVEDNRVGPLYQHVFPPVAAPTLSFVGLPWKVVPFPQFELQSRWIAQVLAGRAQLPAREEMEAHTAAFYASLQAAGVPTRYTHRMSGALQWQYDRWLAQQCGDAALPGFAWREAMYNACGMSRKLHGAGYRDARLPAAAEAEAEAREEAAQLRKQRAAAVAAAH